MQAATATKAQGAVAQAKAAPPYEVVPDEVVPEPKNERPEIMYLSTGVPVITIDTQAGTRITEQGTQVPRREDITFTPFGDKDRSFTTQKARSHYRLHSPTRSAGDAAYQQQVDHYDKVKTAIEGLVVEGRELKQPDLTWTEGKIWTEQAKRKAIFNEQAATVNWQALILLWAKKRGIKPEQAEQEAREKRLLAEEITALCAPPKPEKGKADGDGGGNTGPGA